MIVLRWLPLLALVCCAPPPPEAAIGPGSAAPLFLSASGAPEIRLEVDLLGGVVAHELTRDIASAKVRQLLEKELRLDVDRPNRDYVPPVNGYTVEDLLALEAEHRSAVSDESQTALYVLYAPGHWSGDTEDGRILGAAFSPHGMAIFPDSIANICAQGKAELEDQEARDLLCPLTEGATWMHEFGHLLGLVDNGTPMVTPHRDESHGHHDINESCVMHWSHESGKVAEFIQNRLASGRRDLRNVFDQACRDDLDAAKGL